MHDPSNSIQPLAPDTSSLAALDTSLVVSQAVAVIESVSESAYEIHLAPSNRAQQLFAGRKTNLVKEFCEALKATPKDQQDEAYVQSEEFFDLVLMGWQAAQQTRHHEKIALYAKILAGAVPFQDRNADDPEAYMKVVTALSMEELEVAKAVYHASATWRRYEEDIDEKRTLVFRLPDDPWDTLGPHCPHINREDLPFYLSRLVSAGLIQIYGATTSMDYPGGGEYVVPKTFSKLMNYVKEKWGEE